MASSSRPWFVIAGGGTGGHLYPGLAVAESIRALQPDFEVTIFGTQRPLDQKIAAARKHELVAQPVRPFPSRPWQWPGFLLAWRRSVRAALARFRQRAPSIVLGLGGYAAAPPVVAASKLGLPTAIFNPDAHVGRANRRLANRVDRIFIQWERTVEHFSNRDIVKCTGCPIRAGFGRRGRAEACVALSLDPAKRTLLVTGASQGARSINAAMLELLDLWRVAENWQLLHITGPADEAECRGRYQAAGIAAKVIGYTEKMSYCMAAADLIVSRAGASTLAEITAVGLPSVLMPYPHDRGKHQLANARVLVDAGAAELVEDRADSGDNARRLIETLRDLMRSGESRRRMARAAATLGRPHAAESMAAELFEIARRK